MLLLKNLGHHNNLILGSAPVHATLAQPAAGADSLKDLRARRAQDHACLAVYILKVYILKMTLLVPVEPTGSTSAPDVTWSLDGG